MRGNGLLYLIGCVFYLLFIQAAVFPQTPEPAAPSKIGKPEISARSETAPTPAPQLVEPENLVHIGDLIDVDVVGSTEFDWRGTLTPEGFLNGIDFVESPIFALCQSEQTIARRIAEGYSKLLRDPQISVRIVDRSGRPVSFLYGAVRTPQRFKLNRAVRLSELLILSGGLTEKANGEIQILRSPVLNCRAQAEKAAESSAAAELVKTASESSANFINITIAELLQGDAKANPWILTGDVITVREAAPVYVSGGVANPRQINALSKLTVTRAISSAGGFVKNADREKVIVFRRDGAETKIIEVDLGKIEARETEDLELQAFDVVEVGIKGKDKRKTPPALRIGEIAAKNTVELPLRVIN